MLDVGVAVLAVSSSHPPVNTISAVVRTAAITVRVLLVVEFMCINRSLQVAVNSFLSVKWRYV